MATFVIFVLHGVQPIIAYPRAIRNRLFMSSDFLDSSGNVLLDVVRGKWEKLSLGTLIPLVTRVGLQVSLKTAA